LVCLQNIDGTRLWKRPSECVWTAPDFLRCKIAIAERHGFTEASAISLLQNILNIGNVSFADFIADLRIIRDQEGFDEDGLEVLYKSIELSIAGHANEVRYVSHEHNLKFALTTDRKTFEEENLVYSHQLDPPRWVKLGDCVWSGPKCLQKITKLARCYPSLDKLFTKNLEVKDATPETLLDELHFVKAEFEQNSTFLNPVSEAIARRVTDLLLAFTFKSFTLSLSILEALRTGKFWPYQPCPGRLLYFGRITDTFIIPDHEYFLELFQEKVPVLKLALTEVAAIKPLLIKLGVENKFLSRCVTEIASANDDSLPAEDLSHELCERAQALFWYVSKTTKQIKLTKHSCAEHFQKDMQANRRRGLYQLLKDIQVFRASDISTTYTINAHGTNQSITTKGLMRLDEEGGQLKLFVPRDENDQKEAFAVCLAKEMIRFLGLPEAESWHIITAVLAVEPERLEYFLHRQGISNNHSTTPSGASQAKEMTVCPEEDETILLDKKFRALNISSQQSSSKDDEVLAHALSNSTMAIVQNGSANIKTDINQDPNASDTTSQSPPDSTNRFDPARQEPEPELLLAVPELNIENTPGILESNSGRNDSLSKNKAIHKGANSNHESPFWVSNPPRGRRRSNASHSTEASIESSDDFDAESHSSAITTSSDEGEILKTPSKKTTKTGNQHQIEEALNETYQASRLSSTHLNRSTDSTPRMTHQGPDPRVGYAGEQFIVNLLNTKIEDFDETKHWTSKLRRYANLPPLGRGEITDLEYQDKTGCFSRLLRTWIEGEVPKWLEKACMSETATRPKYWLEVKTTPGKCETVFFVSPHQYEWVSFRVLSSAFFYFCKLLCLQLLLTSCRWKNILLLKAIHQICLAISMCYYASLTFWERQGSERTLTLGWKARMEGLDLIFSIRLLSINWGYKFVILVQFY
jgi:hypothetical protein